MGKEEAERVFDVLRKAFQQICSRQTSTLSFEELYRAAYNLTMQRHEQLIYKGVLEIVHEYLSRKRVALVGESDRIKFLGLLCSTWEEFRLVTRVYSQILLYFDRTYLKQYNKPGVSEMCLHCYQEFLVDPRDGFIDLLISGLLDEMDVLRSIQSDQSRLRIGQLIEMLRPSSTSASEDVFRSRFFDVYTSRMEMYFMRAAAESVSSFDFVNAALASFQLEPEITMLGPTDYGLNDKISNILISCWIRPHYQVILKSFLNSSASMEDLSHLYKLFTRDKEVGAPRFLAAWLGEVEKQVSASMDVVDLIAGLKGVYSRINGAFAGDHFILCATNSHLEVILNGDDSNSVVRKLAVYLDALVREKTGSSSFFDADLNDALLVMRLISSKDLLESFLCQMLAKRLLGTKTNFDNELKVTRCLKLECGVSFTRKMESMMEDVVQSSRLVENAKIISKSRWPICAPHITAIAWPQPMRALITSMNEQWERNMKRRALTWLPTYGSIEMNAKFKAGEYVLTMSTIQGMVLLLMDECPEDTWTIEKLSRKTGVNPNEIERHTLSLTTKHKLLLRDLADGEEHSYKVNPEFASYSRYVKLPLIAGTQADTAQPTPLPCTVDEDRKHSTEAAIVRVMKARRKLDATTLLVEVVNILKQRFMPTVETVQGRIANLIEREFIKHSIEDSTTWYYYVA